LRTKPELKNNLWKIVNALQNGYKDAGFDIGKRSPPVTPVFLNGTIAKPLNLFMIEREIYNIFLLYGSVPGCSQRNYSAASYTYCCPYH
jgi:glycine C-acetyltransferase